MKGLYDVYIEAGIWRKWNWYDFLAKLMEIVKKRA